MKFSSVTQIYNHLEKCIRDIEFYVFLLLSSLEQIEGECNPCTQQVIQL